MKTNKITLFTAALAAVLLAGCASAPPVQHGALKAYTFTNTRDMRFGEILVAKRSGVEVYNTTGMNECPANVWDALDPKQLAKELGALKVIKNGPHFWLMDEQTASFGETETFAGLEARWAATLALSIAKKQMSGHPYTIFMPKKTQRMVYSKGKPVYELVDSEGNAYVMQAHDQQFPVESLATLGEKMKKLPAGWKYRTRILTEDLVLDLTPDQTIYAVGDEFNQYYTRPPNTKSAAAAAPQLMFVQVAEDLKVDATAKTLRLVKVNPQTLYFSDRPVRIAGHVKMAGYLEEWTAKAGQDNFAADPPNATLSVYEPGQADNTIVVVEITNPVVEGADLLYNYKIINGTMPAAGGATALFIDWIGAGGGVGHGFHGVGAGARGRGVR